MSLLGAPDANFHRKIHLSASLVVLLVFGVEICAPIEVRK